MSWYYSKVELDSTPSIKDGMKYQVERQYRREGARFIVETCTRIDLGFRTMATGVVYFQRFYMIHSFLRFPHYLIASCALFLAGKIEETPKQVKDIIKIAKMYLEPAEFAKFGEEPEKEILMLEKILLQSMRFDILVHHPYDFLLEYGKLLENGSSKCHRKIEKILDKAWTFVNDSLWCTTLCLEWEPEVMAIAMLTLAIKFNKCNIYKWIGKNWWEKFVNELSEDQIEDICHEVLDLCFQNPSSKSHFLKSSTSRNQSSHSSNSSRKSMKNTPLKKIQVDHTAENDIPSLPLALPMPLSPLPPELLPNSASPSPLPPPPLPSSLLSSSTAWPPFVPDSVLFPSPSKTGLQMISSPSPYMNSPMYTYQQTFNDLLSPPPPPPPPLLLYTVPPPNCLPPLYEYGVSESFF